MKARSFHKTSRVIAVACVALALAAITARSASAAPITIQSSGSYGYWAGEVGGNVCDWGMGFGAYIHPVEPYITRTPRYPTQTQVIRMFSRVEYWAGSAWKYYTQDSAWSSRTVTPSQSFALVSANFPNVASGRYYRVVQFYEWWVNGVRVGTVTNRFDQSEYLVMGGSTGTTNEGGYCYIR